MREVWKKTTEQDALIGVDMTGIAHVEKLDLKEAADEVRHVNSVVSSKIRTEFAARCTTIKPSGTSSLVLGTSSGIHAWHNDYYLRRMRIGKNEALYNYLKDNHPELLEDDLLNSKQGIVCISQKAPAGSIIRTENVMTVLERVKTFNLEWVRNGYRLGYSVNNVSANISLKDDEWEKVGEWMWRNKASYNGLSMLPFDNGNFKQPPFEDITWQKYEEQEKS